MIPLVLLALLEAALRLAGYGHATAFLVPAGPDARLVPNAQFGWRFHNLEQADPCQLPRVKPAGSLRIFVLGESAAYGTPDSAYSVGRVLEVMLRDRFPGRPVDVINAAMMGLNSHAIRVIAREAVARQADLLVVYMGNNELIGSCGVATPCVRLGPGGSRFCFRALQGLRALRLGQWLDQFGGWQGEARRPQDESYYLAFRSAADDARAATVYANFRANLQDICHLAGAGRTRLVVSTVAVNLRDFPPFGSLHQAGWTAGASNRWEQAYQQGVAAEEARQWATALQHFSAAAELDAGYANLQFRMGRCAAALGAVAQSRARFALACDRDALPFRATGRINQIIREVAAAQPAPGVTLVDGAALLAAADGAEQQIPGARLFWDNVHLRFHGNYELARALFPAVAAALPAPGAAPAWTNLSEEACAARLAYTEWDAIKLRRSMLRVLARPPCTLQLEHDRRLAQARDELQTRERAFRHDEGRRALQIYYAALDRTPQDWYLHNNLAELLTELGKHRRAVECYRWLVARFPGHLPFQLWLSMSLANAGDRAGATQQLTALLRQAPDYEDARQLLAVVQALPDPFTASAVTRPALAPALDPEAARHCQLGNSLIAQGELLRAIAEYRLALQTAPDSALVHNNLGGALFRAQAWDEARWHLNRAVELEPDYASAHLNLGLLLNRCNAPAPAIAHLRRAIELNVPSPHAACKLAWLLATVDDARLRNGAEAARLAEDVCRRTARQQPDPLDALAAAYAEQGRFDDAARTAQEAQRLAVQLQNPQLAAAVGARVALYQAHTPFRLPAGAPGP